VQGASKPLVQAARPAPGSSYRSTKRAIDQLDQRERWISFLAGAISIFIAALVYEAETSNHHFRLQKGELTSPTRLIMGLAVGALLVGATLWGRRAPVGFVALFAGATFGQTSLPLGIPFFALAIWVLYRSYKIQRQASDTLRAARIEDRTSRQAQASPRGASASVPSKRSGGKGPARPTGNKRYTPKRPPPSEPKPSRRERRAASRAD
jgi:hypothetical protein